MHTTQSQQLIVCHKDDQSLYKSTRKMSRTAKRLLSTATNYNVESYTAYIIRGCKNEESIVKRLEAEFGPSVDSQLGIEEHCNDGSATKTLQALRFGSASTSLGTSSNNLGIALVDLDSIMHDLQANAGAAANLTCWECAQRVISSFPRDTGDLVVHIKSDNLYRTVSDILLSKTNGQTETYAMESEIKAYLKQSSIDQEEKVIRRLRQKKGAADCPLSIYPIRYIQSNNYTKLTEICRFHNYDEDRGCLRSKRARDNPNVKGCEMDHMHCHSCGEAGHRAMECPNQRNESEVGPGPMVFVETDEGFKLKPLSDCNDQQRDSEVALPALVILAGRLRGKTLASCEFLPLASDGTATGTWRKMANVLEHRGSHAAASLDGMIYVMGGGGVDGNLDTVECFSCNSTEKRWQTLPGRLSSPRHAFGSVAIMSNKSNDTGKSAKLFAVGGWKYGTVACDAVEKLSIDYPCNCLTSKQWEMCAPLLKPRRLHSVVASADGKQIYVFGGYVDERYTTNSVEKYDIASDQWSACDEMPYRNQHCPMVQAVTDWSRSDNSFLVFPFGTENSSSLHIEVLRYTPGSDNPFKPVLIPSESHENGARQTLHLPLNNWAAFSVTSWRSQAKVYVIGGTINGKWTDRGFQLDLQTMVWTELPAMQCARRRSVALVVDRIICKDKAIV